MNGNERIPIYDYWLSFCFCLLDFFNLGFLVGSILFLIQKVQINKLPKNVTAHYEKKYLLAEI